MVSGKIIVLGAGESGTGAALLAKAKGYDVFVSDKGQIKATYKQQLEAANIGYEEGRHSDSKILTCNTMIKSPGIPDTVGIVKKAEAAGMQIIDEIEFASNYTTGKIIAITGTNGKTTTTLLTYHLLKEAGLSVGLAGNVGHSLAKQVINDNKDYYVVEMSSFQIDGTYLFKPFIGVILNITPDHLDRYDYNLQHYIDSKLRLSQNMNREDHLLYYNDHGVLSEQIDRRSINTNIHALCLEEDQSAAAYYDGAMIHVKGDAILSLNMTSLPLRGRHNAINMMAAVKAVRLVGLSDEQITSGLKSFKNAPHRMEQIATINDISFVNDSKATNVDAVKYALDSFNEKLVWIAGGVDKGNDYNIIMDEVNKKVKALICLGKDNAKLRDAFHNDIIDLLETENMRDAVRGAMKYAAAHDVVLLSPACASFDLFKNYEDRGEQFRAAVLELKEELDTKPNVQ